MRAQFMTMVLSICTVFATDSVVRGQVYDDLKTDEAQIKAIVEEGISAWNSHDMVKFASRFTDDADFINIRGTWWKGKKEIEEAHVAAHRGMFKNSRLTLLDLKIKRLTADVAVAIATAEMQGHEVPKEAYRTNFNRPIQVFVKVKGEWKIASVHNVNLAEPPAKK